MLFLIMLPFLCLTKVLICISINVYLAMCPTKIYILSGMSTRCQNRRSLAIAPSHRKNNKQLSTDNDFVKILEPRVRVKDPLGPQNARKATLEGYRE